MRLLVLGGSGGVGAALIRQAVADGHTVVALARSVLDAPPGVEVVRGELTHGPALDQALIGVDAVLCAVGMRRATPANPWSRAVSPPDLTSTMARRLAVSMPIAGVRRVIAVSAAGVGDSAPQLNLAMRFLLATTMIGDAYRDLARMEQVFAASDLDWLAPRPTRLTDGPPTGRVAVVSSFGSLSAISRADVAGWMLSALSVPTWPLAAWSGRTPQISS
jgi:uncharacterized protein YbjT (DUF2867 family)